MTFPAYPAYKDSSVGWLGGIPSHWNIKKFRYVFEESPEKITDEVVGDMLSVSGYRGVEVKQYDDEGRRRTDEELFGYRVVRPGQLVVNTMWLNYAGLGVSEHVGHVSPAYRSYWIDPVMDKRFVHHLMRSGTYVKGYTQLLTGIRPNSLQMGRDDLMVFPVLLPTKSEQTQIARFLDHETARIDELIEEQQRLIELLKEKRQAVISHAVTKGLDPTVPMKDSGVEWLGEVPVHWDVCSARRVICAIEQGWSPECEANPAAEDAWGILKAGCVNRGVFDPSENKTLPASLEPITEYEVRAGDILMSRASGSPELVGSTALLGEVRERLMLSDKIFRIHLEENFSSSFFVWVMNAQFMRAQIEQALSGGNGLANNLPQASLLAFLLAVPPSNEQDAIADFIDGQIRRLDAMISEGDTGIGLLQERRSALISAAVTGKIDVRGWQPPIVKSTQHRKAVEA